MELSWEDVARELQVLLSESQLEVAKLKAAMKKMVPAPKQAVEPLEEI